MEISIICNIWIVYGIYLWCLFNIENQLSFGIVYGDRVGDNLSNIERF